MKVVITKNFEEKYTALFNEMQALLGDTSDPIDSLATYFQALDHFRADNQILANKFYRLPLEEPPFKVDMDSRTIEVPTVFKNNGLGVKGDTNAEIVFFEMQRWYDTMDLAAQECYIQWTNSSNKIEGNKKGNSPAILLDQVDDILTFGWVITNNMTEQSGNLEFAIRFFTVDEETNTLNYSVSTQKATCVIKPALDLDVVGAKVDNNLENLIVTRPIYSGIINSMNGAAPTITTNLLANLGDKVTNGEADLDRNDPVYDEESEEYNAQYETAAPAGVLRLKVNAKSPDGGTVVYRWYNGKDQLTDITGALDTDSEYLATVAGTYFAQVGNKSTNASTGTRWIYSDTVVVPRAAELQYGDVTKFPAKNYSTGNEDSAMVFDVAGYKKPEDVVYEWKVDDEVVTAGVTGNKYIPPLNTEGIVSCTAVNHRNNTESAPLTVKQTCELRAEPDTPESVQVQWDSTEGKVYATVTFEEGSPSANWQNEWIVTWNREMNVNGNQSSIILNEKSLEFKPKLDAPTKAGEINSYIYSCNVAHTVFAGTAMAKTSPAQYSNKLILEVAYGGTVTARVQ